MWLLYNLLATILSPIWVPWMILRANRRGEPPNWKERGGDYQVTFDRNRLILWVHAVSVGEVIAAMPILTELRKQKPDAQILLTVTTSSGHRTARERAAGLFDELAYFPIDVPRFQLAAMWKVRPDAVAILETELWMNFLWAAREAGAKSLLVNGRISDRNLRRSRHLRFFYGPLLALLDRALMQTEADAKRIEFLGAKSIDVLGNTKYDEAVPEGRRVEVRREFGVPVDAPLVVVGSTRGDREDQIVLEALRLVDRADLHVIYAPRQVEQAERVAGWAKPAFGDAALRSKQQTGRFLILDTFGELARAYVGADVAVVGGGFENLGGSSVIQPMAVGVPVVHGPHMANFRQAVSEASEAGANAICADAPSLAAEISRLLNDPEARQRMGSAGRSVVSRHRGAGSRYAQAILLEAHAAHAEKKKQDALRLERVKKVTRNGKPGR